MHTALTEALCPLILAVDKAGLPILEQNALPAHTLHIQLRKFAKSIQKLKEELIETLLYIRRVELLQFVQWSGKMHFDVQQLRASVESLDRGLKLVERKNRAS